MKKTSIEGVGAMKGGMHPFGGDEENCDMRVYIQPDFK
jgi:hypothetical protein